MLISIDNEYLHDLYNIAQTITHPKIRQILLDSCNDEFQRIERKRVGPLTEEQLILLQETMIDYITNKSPNDLTDRNDSNHPWFINRNNKYYWNWCYKEYPLMLLCNKLNLSVQYTNTDKSILAKLMSHILEIQEVIKWG